VFLKKTGMREAVTAGGQEREALLTTLRTMARQTALAKMQSIDLASLLLASADDDNPLKKGIRKAEPWLQRCGGRRRLLFVMPQELAGNYSPATLAAQLGPSEFKQLPGVAASTTSDLVVLFELGDVSLPHVAAHLLDFRRDLAEAAHRLHTRSDITWTPLFDF
jgi:hypothetical protein